MLGTCLKKEKTNQAERERRGQKEREEKEAASEKVYVTPSLIYRPYHQNSSLTGFTFRGDCMVVLEMVTK